MKRHALHLSTESAGHPRFSRRGGAYIIVLGAATMLTVVGLSAIAISRASIARVSAARDWSAAGVMAESAIEGALSVINTDSTWRTRFAAAPTSSEMTLGSGKSWFSLSDPADAVLDNSNTDMVSIKAIGVLGKAVRVFAVNAQYVPPPALEVLSYAAYAAFGCTTQGTVNIVGGGLRSGTILNNTGDLAADVWAGSIVNSGTIAGEVRTGQAPLFPLSDGTLSSYATSGTVINYSSVPLGTMDKVLLSAQNNPYGSPNASGIYSIVVPATKTLKIQQSRIAATLVVRLSLGSSFEVESEVNWERPSLDQPALVILGNVACSVKLSGSTSNLSEATQNYNFNPATTPYNGQSDSDMMDLYPSHIRGIIHVTGLLTTLELDTDIAIIGTVICEYTLSMRRGANITYDSTVITSPPAPYRTGTASMMPVPGSWVWLPEP